MSSERLDKSVSGMISLSEKRDSIRREVGRLSPQERLSTLLMLREEWFGDEASSPRLQRLFADPESEEGPIYGCRRLGPRTPRVAEVDS